MLRVRIDWPLDPQLLLVRLLLIHLLKRVTPLLLKHNTRCFLISFLLLGWGILLDPLPEFSGEFPAFLWISVMKAKVCFYEKDRDLITSVFFS